MAGLKLFFIAALVASISGGAYARSSLQCEDLGAEDCAFSVSSSGARCVLEKYTSPEGSSIYQCQTSNVMTEVAGEWIESDECLIWCGLERMSVGISSDGITQRAFLEKLCSPSCHNNCPNIVKLFTDLAAGEGVHLPRVCSFLRPSAHRMLADSVAFAKNTDFLIESFSATAAAAAPSVAESLTSGLAPSPAPTSSD